MAVLMMDLDAFKTFNDTFGHPAGDGLLRTVAEAIAGSIRDGDRAYRYGGDEFAVILPGVGRAEAREIADRIRSAVAAASDAVIGPGGPAGHDQRRDRRPTRSTATPRTSWSRPRTTTCSSPSHHTATASSARASPATPTSPP